MPGIVIYGTPWCGDCTRAKAYLDSKRIPYVYIDITDDEAATDFVLDTNSGRQIIPVIVFPGGEILIEPSTPQLAAHVRALGLLASATGQGH